MTNKTTAALLALVLGGLGAHKFYLNRPVQGLFYLIFFWTFVPAVIALLEGISYLTYSESAWNETYNKGVMASVPMTYAPPAVQRDQKKCPDCAELVLAEARKCKHCGCQFEAA